MATVFCGTCGTGLSDAAKFCRACGSAQASSGAAPPPAPPGRVAFAPVAERAPSGLEIAAAVLAIVGGAAICFMTLYAVFYLPLHNDYPVNYGESPRLGDVLAFASGLAAAGIGWFLLARRSLNLTAAGIWLVVAGTPTLIMTVLWAFPETFNLSFYPLPFYFAFVYFPDLAVIDVGEGNIPLPLAAGCAMVIAAGFMIASPSLTRPRPTAGPPPPPPPVPR